MDGPACGTHVSKCGPYNVNELSQIGNSAMAAMAATVSGIMNSGLISGIKFRSSRVPCQT